ncbi:MAG: hypothetical protein KGQ36_04340 [Rickettsiales bacterium]|nr:hypothetical protein [Rickettsiales bacterium]
MDEHTLKVLKIIESHLKIKNYLTVFCYFLIVGGVLFYIFHAINKTNNSIKIISNYQSDPKKYKTTKIMTNPRIDFQYNDNEIYHIEADKAYHENEKEVTMYKVHANGKIGDITADTLQITDEGNHLVFSGHPVLILNSTEKK